jgi:hypothetical protein
MTAINVICDEMNEYINTKGRLPSSTSKSGFLNAWHDLDNEFWTDLFDQAQLIINSGSISTPHWLESNIIWLQQHIQNYGSHHENILNPTPEYMREYSMPKRLTQHSTGKSVKSVLWNTMMNIRERVYNPYMGIDLPNEDASIGKLNPHPRDVLFDWAV